MSEANNSDPPAGGGRDKRRSRRGGKPPSGGRSKASDFGKALRSVYDTTLREDVPSDFLELLGKLS